MTGLRVSRLWKRTQCLLLSEKEAPPPRWTSLQGVHDVYDLLSIAELGRSCIALLLLHNLSPRTTTGPFLKTRMLPSNVWYNASQRFLSRISSINYLVAIRSHTHTHTQWFIVLSGTVCPPTSHVGLCLLSEACRRLWLIHYISLWRVIICASRWRSCEVMYCNNFFYFFSFRTCTSLFLIRDPLSVFALSLGRGREVTVGLLYAKENMLDLHHANTSPVYCLLLV